MNDKKTKKKRLSFPLLGLLLILACGLCFGGITAARYVLDWASGNGIASAHKFYFTSDHLSADDVPVYQLGDFIPGTSKITFTLQNFVDEKRISESEISYTVTADAASAGGPIDSINGTIGVDAETATVNLSVPLDCFANGKATVTVTAVSAPYQETLSAVFVLYQHIESVSYTVYDSMKENRIILYVTTGDKAGTVTIKAPEGVIFDRTDGRLTSFSGQTCTFNANANAEYSFAFFKEDPKSVYIKDNFKLN